ncbi:MAG: class I adenylate-forming enzyme family protein [Longimicrobiales bacterium]
MALIERTPAQTVAAALATRATTDPERVFLRGADRPLGYGEVDSRAESLAAALAHLGVEEGDRVALLLPACPEFVTTLFAVAKLGAVAVPLNPRLTTSDLHYMLRHSEAVCVVTVERSYGIEYLEVFEDLLVSLPDLQYLVTVGDEDLWYDDRIFQFEDLLSAGAGRDYPAPDVDPASDCFAIVYTSGTTGKPKGVELSHANLVATAAASAEALGLTPDDTVVGISSLFHVFALVQGLLGTLWGGASLVLQDEAEAGPTLDLIEAHRATVHFGVPTLFVQSAAEQEGSPRDLSSLRLAVVAGAPVNDELVTRLRSTLCPDVRIAYSLTEASSTVCVPGAADAEQKKAYTVGRPLRGTELRILEEDGSLLPEESVGEIALKGPGVMLGYYRQPRETREAFDANGFLRTGDLGMVDEGGYVHLVGRRKDVIIRSGFNVYPREVESRLEAHPAVQEAVIVGMPDPLLGEAICACIVPIEGAIVTDPELVDWCRETLAESKVPDQVRFFDSFPRTGTGKTRRVELARLIQSEGADPA